jgi:hypothetical protein
MLFVSLARSESPARAIMSLWQDYWRENVLLFYLGVARNPSVFPFPST